MLPPIKKFTNVLLKYTLGVSMEAVMRPISGNRSTAIVSGGDALIRVQIRTLFKHIYWIM